LIDRHIKKAATILVMAPLALLASALVQADELERPNYTYLELDYVYGQNKFQSLAGTDDPSKATWYLPEGIALRGSVDLFEQLLLSASYYTGQGEFKSTTDIEASSGVLRVGWLAPTDDAVGIDVGLDYRADNLKYKAATKIDEDIEGIGASFGVRATPFKNAEFGFRVGWYEGDFNGSIAFQLNAAYNFGERFGINAYWDRMDARVGKTEVDKYTLDQFGLGGRFYF
jgi:hypothetical protein